MKTFETKLSNIIFFKETVVVINYNIVVMDYQVQNLNILNGSGNRSNPCVNRLPPEKMCFSPNNIIILNDQAS